MTELLSSLIRVLWWPYEVWKQATESSRVGLFPVEKKTLRFWYVIAMTATTIIVGIVALDSLALYWIGR